MRSGLIPLSACLRNTRLSFYRYLLLASSIFGDNCVLAPNDVGIVRLGNKVFVAVLEKLARYRGRAVRPP